MKNHGGYTRELTITQVDNGFVVINASFANRSYTVHKYFEGAVNELGRLLGLLDIGERIVLSATKELQEGVSS